jgi:septum formation topological specificity factor MinE
MAQPASKDDAISRLKAIVAKDRQETRPPVAPPQVTDAKAS